MTSKQMMKLLKQGTFIEIQQVGYRRILHNPVTNKSVAVPALFEKEDSRYTVTFPDSPEAITCGDTSEQAIETAKEC